MKYALIVYPAIPFLRVRQERSIPRRRLATRLIRVLMAEFNTPGHSRHSIKSPTWLTEGPEGSPEWALEAERVDASGLVPPR